MIIEHFEDGLKLAKAFLETKKRDNYFDFTALCEENLEECVYSNHLEDDEVELLRALKEKYGEEYIKHLDEVFDDPDIIHDFTCGDEILDIDLDNIKHKYSFSIHELKTDGTISTHSHLVELSDDEYAKLLAWCIYDEHLTINVLRHRDSNLFDCIMREIDSYYLQKEGYFWVDNPYIPTLDEANEDTKQIIRQHNIQRDGFYLGLFPFI